MISLMAAAQQPELIQAVIIADFPLTLETLKPILKSQLDLGQRIIHYKSTNQIERLYQEINDDFAAESMWACDTDVITTTFYNYKEMLDGYDIEKLLPLIKSSLLIMRGQEELGSMIRDDDMRKVVDLYPQVIQHKITNAGHSLLMNKAIILARINDFLKNEGDIFDYANNFVKKIGI